VALYKKNIFEKFGTLEKVMIKENHPKNENIVKKSVLIWLSIIPLAILNGVLRQTILTPWLGKSYAQPISGIILCLLIFIVSFVFIPRIGKGESKTYLKIGLLWIVLTLAFETLLVLAMGNSLGEVLKAYDITTGNIWLIVVVFTGIAPWLIAKIRCLV
jgi:hypothetical protein